jgi:serine protease Do
MRLLSLFASLLIVCDAFAMTSYADLVDEVMPSVVNISTQKEVIAEDDATDNMMINPTLNGRESLGSGFFIRTEGYILTNLHVIDGAKKITVITNNDKQYEAKIIGKDTPSDLAVLKIEDKDAKFKPVKFGDVDEARIGDIILAFGNPYGLGLSVSQGIISAKSRSIGIGEQQYIQTDAAINQGNSGGPLFNLDGEVIGVNSAIFKDIGANGVGFSLPSNIANWISNQLIDTGHVKRGWIGLKVAIGIDKYTDKSGFMVTEIDENSNAFKEGIRVGDIITFYNDKPANDLNEFIQFTETMEPGQALRLKTLSYGQETRNVIRVQEMPAETLKNITNKALIESKMYAQKQYGDDIFYISELKIAVKEANPRGLAVVKLERKSPLFGKGIEEGDIILEADRSDIYSVDNLLDNIRNSIVDDYRPISLLIQGIDNTFYANIELEPEND